MSVACAETPTAGVTPSDGAMLDSRQVAAMLNVSIASLHRWARLGELPGAVRFGRRTVRWRREVIESIVAGRLGA